MLLLEFPQLGLQFVFLTPQLMILTPQLMLLVAESTNSGFVLGRFSSVLIKLPPPSEISPFKILAGVHDMVSFRSGLNGRGTLHVSMFIFNVGGITVQGFQYLQWERVSWTASQSRGLTV
ncbi:hypothetical protein N7490_006683 [Penicillium lividum]|nr:hypothetical protein N7490_006683 [Penicillium lividum]